MYWAFAESPFRGLLNADALQPPAFLTLRLDLRQVQAELDRVTQALVEMEHTQKLPVVLQPRGLLARQDLPLEQLLRQAAEKGREQKPSTY